MLVNSYCTSHCSLWVVCRCEMGSPGRAKNAVKKKGTGLRPINVENEGRKNQNVVKVYTRPDNILQKKNDSVIETEQVTDTSVSLVVECENLAKNNPDTVKLARKQSNRSTTTSSKSTTTGTKSTTTATSDSDDEDKFAPLSGDLEVEKSTPAKDLEKKQNKSKKRKKKAKKKKVESKKPPADEEDIDKILEEFKEMEVAPKESPKLNMEKLLTVQYRNLQPENEYDRKRGVVRKNRMPRAAGRMVISKPLWPDLKYAGITMQRYNCALDPQLLYFTFDYDVRYRIFEQQLQAHSIPSPHLIFRILGYVPYHIPALIQASECAVSTGNYESGQEFAERAIYAYESAVHCMFNVISGKCRLLYSIPNNRRAMFFCMRRELYRTALEYAKVIYNLNPEEDPLAVVLIIDYLFLVNKEYDKFVLFYTAKEKAVSLQALPNMSYSIALARFFIAQKSGLQEDYEAADKALLEAMVRFPTLLPALFSTLNLEYRPAEYFSVWCYKKFFREYVCVISFEVWLHFWKNVLLFRDKRSLVLLYDLYMARIAFVWKENGVAAWVKKICRQFGRYMKEADSEFAKQMAEYTIIRNRCYYGVPTNVLRHLYLMNCRHLLSGTEEMKKIHIVQPCDPFPPVKKVINMFHPSTVPALQILAPTTSFGMDMLGNAVFRPFEALRALITRIIVWYRALALNGRFAVVLFVSEFYFCIGTVESSCILFLWIHLSTLAATVAHVFRILSATHVTHHQGVAPYLCKKCGTSFASVVEKEEHVKKTHLDAKDSKSASSLESHDMKRLYEDPMEQEDKADRGVQSPESLVVDTELKEEILNQLMNLKLSSPVKPVAPKQEYCTCFEPKSVKSYEKEDGNSKNQLIDVFGRSDDAQLRIQENVLGSAEKIYQGGRCDRAIANKRQNFPSLSAKRINGINFPSSAVGGKVNKNFWRSEVAVTVKGKGKDENPIPNVISSIRKHKAEEEILYEFFTVEERFSKAQMSMKLRFKKAKKDHNQE
ncbi:Transcription factor 25 [Trichinella nelsoni]|uniref:Transcription factor 25 n=1 Tax=Trichinella nelsoni TaxID=6336 RepID=A0A0V0SIA9_9BILA|nr:Transcription factor 25 [Trichinella nelsoni]